MLAPLPPPLTCQRCNFLVHLEWIYCEQCGYQLQSTQKQGQSATQVNVQNHYLLKAANINQISKQGKSKSRKNKEKELKIKKKIQKLEELEEKRFREAVTVVEKFEKKNNQMVRFYRKMVMNGDKKLPSLCLPEGSSAYLDEQPSIIDRLTVGFTAEEEAERVLFWGKQTTEDITPPIERKFFTGTFWGQSEEGAAECEATEGGANDSSEGFDENDSSPMIHWSPVTEIIPETSQHPSPVDDNGRSASESLESTRRDLTRRLLKAIQLLKWMLRETEFDLVVDPITLPHSLRRFSRYSLRLTAVIRRAYDTQLVANELSHRYILTADRLRQHIAFQIAEAQHEADYAHHQCQELYETVSRGVFLSADCQPEVNHSTLTDPILIQRNQQRVVEYSQTLLDPVRVHVNSLIAKETQIIHRIKYDRTVLFRPSRDSRTS
jgi:hypothetical protein